MALEPAGLTWLNENLDGFIRGIGRANEAMASTGEAARRAGGGFSLLEGVVMGVASSFTTFALDAVTKLGQAVVGLSTSSIEVAGQFQTMGVNLEYAGAQFKEAADAVGGFDEIALQVGGDTRLVGVSATGAADAMTGLLKSGLSLNDVMGDTNAYMKDGAELGGALRASIDLAAASELDMVQASDLAVVVMSTFNKSAEEITGAMDYMVKTADASVAEVSDLSQALVNIGPTAAAAGISFEDVNVALALLSTRGIKGAEAGTALKSMLANLRRPTKKVVEELDKWGISLYDATGAMVPLPEILGQFEVAMAGATQQERDLAIQTVAGTYGMNAMNALLGAGIEGWSDMATSIGQATDMSAKAAAQSQTYAGQMEALQGVIETLKIRIGTALLPALTETAKLFSELVERYGPQLTAVFERVGQILESVVGAAFALVAGDVENFQEYLGEVISYLLDLITGGNATVETINSVWAALEKLWTVAATAGQFIGELAAAFSGGWPAISAVLMEWATKFWDWLMGPGGAVETGGGIIASAMEKIGEWLVTYWPIVRARLLEWADHFWDWLRDVAVPAAKEKLVTVSQAIEDWARSESTQASLSAVGEAVGAGLVDGVRLLVGATTTWAPIMVEMSAALAEAAVKSIFPAMREVGKSVVGGVAEGVAESLGVEIPDAVKETISEIGLLAGGPAGGLLFFQEQIEHVGESWQALRKLFGKEGKKIEKEVPKPFEKAADETRDIFEDLSRDLVGRSIVPDMMKYMERIISSSLKTIQSTWADAWDRMRGAVQSAWREIESAVRSGLADVLSAISGALKDFTKKGREIAENIASGISSAWREVTSAISSGVDALLRAVSSALSSFLQAGREIAESIASGISAAWREVTSAISGGMNSLVSAVNSSLSAMVQAGRSIASSIASGISAAWSSVYSTLSTLASGLQNAVFGVGSVIAAKIVSGISQGLGLFWSGVSGVLSSLASGLATAVNWAASVAGAGAKIVDGIIEGVVNNWWRFVNWLKSAIAGIFGASEPTDADSPFRSAKLRRSGEWIGNAIVEGIQASLSRGLVALPAAAYVAPPVMGLGGPAAAQYTNTVTVPVGPVYIQSPADMADFEIRVERAVERAVYKRW